MPDAGLRKIASLNTDVQISALARELNVTPGRIVRLLEAWGLGRVKSTSWLRAGLANKIRSRCAAANEQFIFKCPSCSQVIGDEPYTDHLKRCAAESAGDLQIQRRSAETNANGDRTLAAIGPLAKLTDLAASRGIPGNIVREQMRMAGATVDQMSAVIERMPTINRPGYSISAVAAFRRNFEIQQLPFTLLPPGTWEAERVITNYRDANERSNTWNSGQLDLGRLTGLMDLGPSRCYLGTELWSWYVLFEFDELRAGVLECPYTGNATYAIRGDWKTGRTSCRIQSESLGQSLLDGTPRWSTKKIGSCEFGRLWVIAREWSERWLSMVSLWELPQLPQFACERSVYRPVYGLSACRTPAGHSAPPGFGNARAHCGGTYQLSGATLVSAESEKSRSEHALKKRRPVFRSRMRRGHKPVPGSSPAR